MIILSNVGMITGTILAAIGGQNLAAALVAGAFLGFMEAGLLVQFFTVSGNEFNDQELIAVNVST
jgi:hypothetical protein